jgi:hypothetical protein
MHVNGIAPKVLAAIAESEARNNLRLDAIEAKVDLILQAATRPSAESTGLAKAGKS